MNRLKPILAATMLLASGSALASQPWPSSVSEFHPSATGRDANSAYAPVGRTGAVAEGQVSYTGVHAASQPHAGAAEGVPFPTSVSETGRTHRQ